MTEQLTELELELLRLIDRGRDPGFMGSIQEQFQDHHKIPPYLVDPDNPAKGTRVDVLARKLARLGLITVQEQRGFGWPQVTITPAGEAYLRGNAA